MNSSSNSARILVVDDEETIRKNIARLLVLEGHEVVTAADGAQALVLARAMAPDIIVTDVNMPVLNGFGLLDAVRADEDLVDCPVIMLTAVSDRSSIRRGLNGGANDYITKPFRREDLLGAVKAQLTLLNLGKNK